MKDPQRGIFSRGSSVEDPSWVIWLLMGSLSPSGNYMYAAKCQTGGKFENYITEFVIGDL